MVLYSNVISSLVAKKEVDLHIYFQLQKIDVSFFTEIWLLSSFTNLFSERSLLQIWDQIMLNGWFSHFSLISWKLCISSFHMRDSRPDTICHMTHLKINIFRRFVSNYCSIHYSPID